MSLLMCIDDTDDLESPGTGEVLQNIGKQLEQQGLARAGFVTRHQLFLHDSIAYTSHNSSMCFELRQTEQNLAPIIELAQDYLNRYAAPGSDPGLCVFDLRHIDTADYQVLLDYGQMAKKQVLEKKDAYQLAERIAGVYLSEHGGTGEGVIGALAGCALRLSGNDGRVKGKLKLNGPPTVQSVLEIKETFAVQSVKDILQRQEVPDADSVLLSDGMKKVFLDHRITLMLTPNRTDDQVGAKWQVCAKKDLRDF